MNKKSVFYILLFAVIFAMCLTCLAACVTDEDPEIKPDRTVTETVVKTYDGPNVLKTSSKLSFSVEGKPVFVYDTRVNHMRSFTYTAPKTYNQVVVFDFEGKIKVEAVISGTSNVSEVVVRPLSYGVKPTVSGNKISFELEYTDNYVLEYVSASGEKASENALHIFANPIEKDAVDPSALPEKTVYIGPGVWMANAIPVSEDDTTVYIAGGAVVYGQIRTANLKNITVRGRGIISGELYERTKASEFTLPIELQNCENVTIKDITILDPAGWAVTLYKCKNVQIENLKIITARANGDGISVQSCSDVSVKNGFVRTWDDSLVVKNVDNFGTDNITFDGVTVWTDLAQSCEVGFETYGPSMTNIAFRNITVLHNFHKAVMSIHNADNAVIDNVTYEKITVEDAKMLGDNQNDGENDFLIDMTIAFSPEWTQSGGNRGSIKNVTIKNVKVIEAAQSLMCRMYGEGTSSNIDGVSIENVEIAGQKIKNLEELKLTPGVYATGIKYSVGQAKTTGASKVKPYLLELKNDAVNATNVPSVLQNGLQVPSFAILTNEPTYVGKKADVSSAAVRSTFGAGDKATSLWNLGEAQSVEGKEASKLLDGDRETEWQAGAWRNEENEFIALSFDFGAPVSIGNIRIFGKESSDIMTYFNLVIFGKTEQDTLDTQTGERIEKWKRTVLSRDYVISPQNSNYADVKVTEQNYYGLQLRLFKKSGIKYPASYSFSEIEFYPPSLTTGKAFVEDCEHEDVYDINYLCDGNPLTYFEGKKGVFPAAFALDMGREENVKYINIHLPPLLLWEARTQEIEVQGSLDGKTFFTVTAKKTYLFDPAANGNMAAIILDSAVTTRYIRLVYTSNSTEFGAQISELYVYGE